MQDFCPRPRRLWTPTHGPSAVPAQLARRELQTISLDELLIPELGEAGGFHAAFKISRVGNSPPAAKMGPGSQPEKADWEIRGRFAQEEFS
jgi:hypothetical protein